MHASFGAQDQTSQRMRVKNITLVNTCGEDTAGRTALTSTELQTSGEHAFALLSRVPDDGVDF